MGEEMGRSWRLLNPSLIPMPSPSFLLLAVLATKLAKLNMWVYRGLHCEPKKLEIEVTCRSNTSTYHTQHTSSLDLRSCEATPLARLSCDSRSAMRAKWTRSCERKQNSKVRSMIEVHSIIEVKSA